ncbi:CoA transferase [bacterium]|nr:CoA transferase [bacterium]
MRDFLMSLQILDFTRLVPGPYATQILGDLGATVVKIESVDGGDYARYLPPLAGDYGSLFQALNRGKKGLTLNLKDERAHEIVKRLLGEANVVIESFRSGVMDRLGLGYEDLKKVRPDLIYVSLSGYGATGPWTRRAAHDIDLLAVTGMASMIGIRDKGLALPGLQIADMASGLFIVIAVAAAAVKRAATGEGAYIDLSMADSTLSLMSIYATQTGLAQKAPEVGDGVLGGGVLCYNIYECFDGRCLGVGALEPNFWFNLCNAIGATDLLDHAMSDARPGNPHYDRLCEIFRTKTRDEWAAILENMDACVEPILDVKETVDHPLFEARGMVARREHDGEGELIFVDTPVAPDGCEGIPGVPRPGEHSVEILKAAGYSQGEIDALAAAGAVGKGD